MTALFRLAALAAVLVPLAARAEIAGAQLGTTLPGGVYVTPRLGFYVPQHDDMTGFNTGFGLEVAAGKRFTPNFAAELAVGYFGSETDTISAFDPDLGTFSGKADFSAIPLTASGKLIVPLNRADLFAVGGLGLVFSEVSATAQTSFGGGSASYSHTSPALLFGMGGSFALTQRASIDVLWRYIVGTTEVNGESGRYDGMLVTGGLAIGF